MHGCAIVCLVDQLQVMTAGVIDETRHRTAGFSHSKWADAAEDCSPPSPCSAMCMHWCAGMCGCMAYIICVCHLLSHALVVSGAMTYPAQPEKSTPYCTPVSHSIVYLHCLDARSLLGSTACCQQHRGTQNYPRAVAEVHLGCPQKPPHQRALLRSHAPESPRSSLSRLRSLSHYLEWHCQVRY